MFSFLNHFKSLDKQRLHALRQTSAPALKTYLAQPFPNLEQTMRECTILSLDFETTGLNAKQDKLLSIGSVEIQQGIIKLNTCSHQIIKVANSLKKANVVIHQITDTEKEQGVPLKQALDDLFITMTGKILLVHYAKIEREFIEQACLQTYGIIPPLLIIDTLALIKQRFDISDTPYDPSRLRLANLRESYQLPAYSSHNALTDAISTAELLLAEVHQQKQGVNTKLRALT